MNQVTTKKNKRKPAAKKPQTRFEKKWAEIERKQKRNKQFQDKMADLYQSFEIAVLPAEKALIDTKANFARHLMGFIKYKSLNDNHRAELIQWINEVLAELLENPFTDTTLVEQLGNELTEILTQFQEKQKPSNSTADDVDEEITVEQLEAAQALIEEIFEGQRSFDEAQLTAFIKDPELLERELEDFYDEQLEGVFSDEAEEETEYERQQAEREQKKVAKQQARIKHLFEDAELGKIYKQLANKLHPDKETDPEAKAYKAEQMSILSKAKKAKDAFTLLQMYQTHLPEKAKEVDPNLSESFSHLLNLKIDELDREHTALSQGGDLQSMVWQKLGARSKKQTDKNLNEYVLALDENRLETEAFINEVRTVKDMKIELDEREEMFEEAMFHEDFFDEFGQEGDSIWDEEIPF